MFDTNLPARARWPLRIFLGSVVALAVGVVVLGAEAHPWLLGLVGATGAMLAWTWWDETKGRGAALSALRKRWQAELGAVDHGDDLHLLVDNQPLVLRLAMTRSGALAAAVMTPLPESTTAFRIASKTLPPPGFDGVEPAFGGPPIQALPGLASMLGEALAVEGNAPAQLARWLDQPLIMALVNAATTHPESFRGLTFDGRFLAVHWLGEVVRDPQAVMALAAPLWRAFVPRLPPPRPELLN